MWPYILNAPAATYSNLFTLQKIIDPKYGCFQLHIALPFSLESSSFTSNLNHSLRPMIKLNCHEFYFLVGGAGGKGTWGKAGVIYDAEVSSLDEKDPNYDSDKEVSQKSELCSITLCFLEVNFYSFNGDVYPN